MSFKVCVKTDFPASETVLDVSASTKVSELFDAAEKALSSSSVSTYKAKLVNYGEDVVEIPPGSESKSISEFSARNGSTVILFAPGEVKPQRKLPKAKVEEKEEKKEEKSKYEGYTAKNVLEKFRSKSKKIKQVALEFIDSNTPEVFNDPSFLKLSVGELKEILARDSLTIEEDDVCHAVCAWTDAQEDKEKANEYLQNDIFPLVRVPLLTMPVVAGKVTAKKLLSQQQLLDLFTYLAPTSTPKKLPESLASFSTKPRLPPVQELVFCKDGASSYSYDYPRGYCFVPEKDMILMDASVRIRATGTGRIYIYDCAGEVMSSPPLLAKGQDFPDKSFDASSPKWYTSKFDKVKLKANNKYGIFFELTSGSQFYYTNLPGNKYSPDVPNLQAFSKYSTNTSTSSINIADNYYLIDLKINVAL